MLVFAKFENTLNNILLTWGRNIFPAPKRSPTIFMPFIKGPSIIFRGLGYFSWFNLASSVSAVTYFPMPWIRKRKAFIFLKKQLIFSCLHKKKKKKTHHYNECTKDNLRYFQTLRISQMCNYKFSYQAKHCSSEEQSYSK